MLKKLIQFELGYHTKKLLFVFAAFAFLFFGFAFSANNLRIPNVYKNSPYVITYILGLLSLGAIFITTIFSGNSVLRDRENNMAGIIHSTPVSKFNFLFGRFTGSFAASIIAFSFACLGVLLGTFMHLHDPEKLGDTNLLHYVWILTILVLPNIFFCASLMFLIAVATKSRIATYTGGLFIYILYIVASIFSNAPWMAGASPADAEAMSLAAKLDPFGISAFFEQTRYWSVLNKNTKLISLEGDFLINRAIWFTVSIAILIFTYNLFSFTKIERSYKRKTVKDESVKPSKKYSPVIPNPESSLSQWNALKSLTAIELTTILKSLPFIMINLCWLFLVGSETMFSVYKGLRLSPLYPVTGIMISNIMEILPFFGTIVIIFYSTEQIWRNRSLKIDEINDSAPVSNTVLFFSKYFTLALIPLILITESIIIGVLIQISKGYFSFEPLVYLSVYYYTGLPLILTAILALFIQSLIPNKYLGMLITGLFLLITNSPFSSLLGIEHVLLRYALPLKDIEFSDMNGFGQYTEAFMWRMIYWSALAAILAILTYGLWQRGKENNLVSRFKLLFTYLSRAGKAAAAFSIIIFLFSGYYIFYNTNIINEYVTREEERNWSQFYEEKYKQFENQPQPTITSIKADIDLFPDEQRYKVKTKYKIKNEHDKELKKFLLGISKESTLNNVKIERAKLTGSDEEFGHYWYEFESPLQPGEEIEIEFEFESGWSPFKGHARFNAIVENGSFMRISRYFPFFGYDSGNELTNADLRRERGLTEHEGMKKLTASSSEESENYDYDFISFEATVSTSADQIAVVPGDLLNTWTEDDRSYFHYKVDGKIPNRFAVSSAKYEVEKANHEGIDIEIYYHPGHSYNIETIIKASKHAIDYCTKHFGPYKYKQIRIAEVSKFTYGFAATAYPNTLYGIEHLVFISDLRGSPEIDWLYQGIAHEISHQWWGGQIRPEAMEGGIVLTESLAQYTQYMIYEEAYGKEAVNKSLNAELDIYLSQRGFTKEVPLYIARDNHPHIPYNKGAKVMYAVKELIGEEAVNKALRNLIEKYSFPNQRPTSYDLLNELYEVTPVEHHSLIDDWMKRIVVYDLKVEQAMYSKLDDGRYKVDMKIIAKKFEDDGLGNETRMNINEQFDIGIFAENEYGKNNTDGFLYFEKHHFDAEVNTLSIIVDKLPVYAGVDPFIHMIDKDRADNLKKIEAN